MDKELEGEKIRSGMLAMASHQLVKFYEDEKREHFEWQRRAESAESRLQQAQEELAKEKSAHQRCFELAIHHQDRAEAAESRLQAVSEALNKVINYTPEMEGEEWNPVNAYIRIKQIAREALAPPTEPTERKP